MSVARRRQREREERRQQILSAARRVFRAKGLAAATMDDVAAEAELSKGTLYLYFGSRDELFLAMAATRLDRVLGEFQRILDEDRSGIETVRQLLFAEAEVALSDPDLFRLAISWVATDERVNIESPAFCRHRQRIQAALGHLVAALERGQRDGSVRTDLDPTTTASQVWGGMLGTLMIRANGEELARRVPLVFDLERQVPGFVGLICDGLRTTETEVDKENGS